jgi:hypothetical protein
VVEGGSTLKSGGRRQAWERAEVEVEWRVFLLVKERKSAELRS